MATWWDVRRNKKKDLVQEEVIDPQEYEDQKPSVDSARALRFRGMGKRCSPGSPKATPPLSPASAPLTSKPRSGPPPATPTICTADLTEDEISQREGLKEFLIQCQPPMGHFLDHLIVHGCRSIAYLAPLKESSEEIFDQMLSGIPEINGRKMTHWDVKLLRLAILKFEFGNKE